jgi:hypothetical protein
MSGGSVLHCLRHTGGTWLGESEEDAFSIMRRMGDSSATVSQRRVRSTIGASEQVVDVLEAPGARVVRNLAETPKAPEGAPLSRACQGRVSVSC